MIQPIQEWLVDSDPGHLLDLEESYHELREVNVGVYTAPGLVVRDEAREVRIVPIARMVVGPLPADSGVRMNRAFGRVDMTDGGEKFMLFRSEKDPSDEWVIVDDRGYVVRKFDRQTFEEAMQRLLE